TAEHGFSWIIPRLVGPGRALDLIWTSERIDAKRALEIGLVEHVCEPDELMSRARAYIEKLAISAPAASMAEAKKRVYNQLGTGHLQAVQENQPIYYAAIARPDANEGVQAFVEKRLPRFARLGG